jgi:predicted secreted Zn-dependent protease
MNSTIISEEKLLELKDLARKIEENSLPWDTLSVEIQQHEKREKEKAIKQLTELILKIQ